MSWMKNIRSVSCGIEYDKGIKRIQEIDQEVVEAMGEMMMSNKENTEEHKWWQLTREMIRIAWGIEARRSGEQFTSSFKHKLKEATND